MAHESLLAHAMTLEEMLRTLGKTDPKAEQQAEWLKILLDTARNGSVEISFLQAAIYDREWGFEAALAQVGWNVSKV